MIEKTVIDYLVAANITGVGSNVFAETPAMDIPQRYIIVEKTGSGRYNHIDQAMVAVQSISEVSLLEAMTLNEAVKEAMLGMADTINVYSCKLNSDYNYTDTRTKKYRYQAVFNITY